MQMLLLVYKENAASNNCKYIPPHFICFLQGGVHTHFRWDGTVYPIPFIEYAQSAAHKKHIYIYYM